MQEQLQSSVEAQEKAEEQCKTLRERNSELESALQKSQLESTSAIDELKLKVRIFIPKSHTAVLCASLDVRCWLSSCTGWNWSEAS